MTHTIHKLFLRVLQSISFRSGYRLISHSDPRATELPKLAGTEMMLSALHAHQVQYGIDSRFIEKILQILDIANKLTLKDIDSRIPDDHEYKGAVDHWPGEHYRLLAAIVSLLQPEIVVEIGTYTGLSYLALASKMREDATLITFDVIPHEDFSDTLLREDDFPNAKRYQVVGDLSDHLCFLEHKLLFQGCDLLFLDGPKDWHFEYRFWELLQQYGLKKGCIVVVDDIRLPSMLEFWEKIRQPKIDLVSFGHFTGTGIFWNEWNL